MVKLAVLKENVGDTLDDALENLKWSLFETWLGIYKNELLSAC